ncbi:MAG: hypothetical protein ACOC2N_05050 [Spirochaetota bacterium]
MAPGDTVVTTTFDALGQDEALRKVADRGDPMTGPFFVEGAKPGDTLLVVFESIEPNRRDGFTSPRLAAGVLDPGFPVTHDEGIDLCRWEIDVDSRSARLVEPASRLSGLPLPLAAHSLLGQCVEYGVAERWQGGGQGAAQ